MKRFLNTKFIIIFSVITFILVIISLFQRPAPPTPAVMRTYPAQEATNIPYFDPIQIEFDRVIEIGKVEIVSDPPEEWTKTLREANILVLDHKQYFRVDKEYVVSVSYEGKVVHTLRFRTTPQQSDPRYAQEVKSQMDREYPLATFFPYENSEYTVMYKSPLLLEITPKGVILTEEDMIREVRELVKEQGVDPETHKYTVARSTAN